MNSKCILAHHGSPGSNRDFLHLKLLMPEIHFEFYDRVESKLSNTTKPHIQLGYSFGCVSAIITAAKNDLTEQLILISPFLFPENKNGSLIKKVMNSRPLRNSLLKIFGAKKIEHMLITSAYPKEVPSIYREDSFSYLNPDRLAHSILEKEYDLDEVFHSLRILEKRKTPVYVLYGEKDKTSLFNKQIKPLLDFSNIESFCIEDAGHALLWTHTEILSNKLKSLTDKIGYLPGKDTRNNVASFLKRHLGNFPERKILTWVPTEELKKWNGDINTPFNTKSVNVKELDFLVGVLTHEFRKLGISFGDRVILFLPMSLPMYASMFALQKMGAIPTFLDSWARRDQMGASAVVAAPIAMISAHKAFAYLDDVEEIKNIKIKIVAGPIPDDSKYSARLELLMDEKNYDQEIEVEQEDTALITFTTGSSGTPKGADRSHRFLAAQHYALNRNLPYERTDKDLPVFPIFSLNNLAAGVETIIPAIDVGNPAETDASVFIQSNEVDRCYLYNTLSFSL